MPQTAPDSHDIHEYIAHLFAQEDEILRWVRESLIEQGLPDIAITAEEGAFLSLLVRACRAHRALEIGTLAGYSTLWIARALPPNGIVVTIEKSTRHAALARQNFEQAGLAERIILLEGEAENLLSKAARWGPFDFVFIDADKEGYPFYYEWALNLIPSGGVIALHNALWGGSVALPYHGPAIDAIRNFNHLVANDSRVVAHIYPAGDGTLIAVKR